MPASAQCQNSAISTFDRCQRVIFDDLQINIAGNNQFLVHVQIDLQDRQIKPLVSRFERL